MSEEISRNKKIYFLKKSILFGVFFLAFFAFFFFAGEKDAHAQNNSGYNGTCLEKRGFVARMLGFKFYYYENESKAECDNRCANSSSKCFWRAGKLSWLDVTLAQTTALETSESLGDYSCDFLKTPVMCLLSPLLWFVRLLLLGAVTFFSWIIDVNTATFILDGGGTVYKMWTTIRDLLNIVFILVLLFSAFCTIFQIAKYNYKKILLTLVIMALLVNFSYPIARVIIDASNVMMYSLVNLYFQGGASSTTFFTADIVGQSGLGELLRINNYPNAGTLLAAVIFIFMFAITLFAFAILLFIRLLALAIIIMFSPIGFVGNIMPGFEKYASQWWDNLFKYAFFGPIMMIGLHIAIQMMTALNRLGDFQSAATKVSTGVNSDLLSTLAFLMIPNIILWMVMGLGQSMSIAGASTVMGAAQKVIKGAGKKFSGANWAKKNWGDYKKAREARKEEARWKPGKRIADKFNNAQDSAMAKLGSKDAQRRMDRRKRGANAKMVRDEAEDLKGARIEDLNIEINNSFDATTGNVDPSKVNRTSAGNAQAYMNKQGDDRKTFVEDEIRNRGSANIANMMVGAPGNILAAQASVLAGPGPTNPGYQDSLRQMTSYINKKSEELITSFTG